MPVQNVFNPLLGRQRSVSDYLEEYDAADARRNINALQAMQLQGAQSEMADREKVRNILAQYGATDAGVQALRGSGSLMGMEQAGRLDQALEALRQRERDAQFRGSIPSPRGQAASAALSGGGGPTVANAQRIAPVDPFQQQMHDAMRLGQIKPMEYLAATRKDTAPVKLGAGEALFDLVTKQPIFSNPKEDAKPSAVREYEFAVQQGYKGSFEDFKRAGTPSTNISVNTGQRGFDNTLKLRGDFRSEPVYKAHQEMQAAYAQIQQSLKQASPAGDLAGATKIMKLLDPGSVVRESELGMAMQASGLMDRVENYAKNILAGTKLTPTQRADFQLLADALYGESVKQYNAKRGEYQGIAERNGLPIADVLGKESQAPNGVWSIKPKGK